MPAGENPGLILNPKDASDDIDEILDAEFAKRRCCFCFRRTSTSSAGHGYQPSSLLSREQIDESWWVKGWKKMREWLEIVVGPKWKTFIRRFGKNRPRGGGRHGKFGYDPLSYAMNFDEGQGGGGNNYYWYEDVGFRDFSSRYAAVRDGTSILGGVMARLSSSEKEL